MKHHTQNRPKKGKKKGKTRRKDENNPLTPCARAWLTSSAPLRPFPSVFRVSVCPMLSDARKTPENASFYLSIYMRVYVCAPTRDADFGQKVGFPRNGQGNSRENTFAVCSKGRKRTKGGVVYVCGGANIFHCACIIWVSCTKIE